MKNLKQKIKGSKIPEPKLPLKAPPIVIVPDKSYIGDDGNIIPTDVIMVSDPQAYIVMYNNLASWSMRTEEKIIIDEG